MPLRLLSNCRLIKMQGTKNNSKLMVLLVSISTLIFVLDNILVVNGFAAWLKCYVDLTDPEEVIMNDNIILPGNERNDNMYGEPITIQFKILNNNKDPNSQLWYSADEISLQIQSLFYDNNKKKKNNNKNDLSMIARLKVPNMIQNDDIQYVMEILNFDTLNSNSSKKKGENPSTTNNIVEFVRPTMCNGKRSHAKQYSTPVEFIIRGDYLHATGTKINQQQQMNLEFIAAWAKGHEPVKITKTVTISLQATTNSGTIPDKEL